MMMRLCLRVIHWPLASCWTRALSRRLGVRQSPAAVARFGLRALGRKASAVPGLLNKFYAFQNRIVPRMFPVRLFGFLIRNALTGEARVKRDLN